jgi:predicted nucleic-acid-binding protein
MLYVKDLFFKLKEKREKVFVPVQTISEVVEILETKYKLRRVTIAEYIFAILSNYMFYVEKNELFYRAMVLYEKYPLISIKKILISEETKDKKISKILTIDSSYEYLDVSMVHKI